MVNLDVFWCFGVLVFWFRKGNQVHQVLIYNKKPAPAGSIPELVLFDVKLGVANIAISQYPNIPISQYPISTKYRSASKAAIQPVPAAVTAWR